MRVASDAILGRAADVRSKGQSWLELTRTDASRKAGLDFFKGSRSVHASAKGAKHHDK